MVAGSGAREALRRGGDLGTSGRVGDQAVQSERGVTADDRGSARGEARAVQAEPGAGRGVELVAARRVAERGRQLQQVVQ